MLTVKMIKQQVKERLGRMPMPEEVRQSIQNSDQFRNFIDGLTNKLNEATKLADMKLGRPVKMSTITETIDDFTDMFVKSFVHDQVVRNENEHARLQREKLKQEKEDLDNTIDGESSGVYEELGVEFERDEVQDEQSDI